MKNEGMQPFNSTAEEEEEEAILNFEFACFGSLIAYILKFGNIIPSFFHLGAFKKFHHQPNLTQPYLF